MAQRHVALRDSTQWWELRVTDGAQLTVAASLEGTAYLIIAGLGPYLTLQSQAQLRRVGIRQRNGRQQQLRVRMIGPGEDLIGGSCLHDVATVQHDNAVGQI